MHLYLDPCPEDGIIGSSHERIANLQSTRKRSSKTRLTWTKVTICCRQVCPSCLAGNSLSAFHVPKLAAPFASQWQVSNQGSHCTGQSVLSMLGAWLQIHQTGSRVFTFLSQSVSCCYGSSWSRNDPAMHFSPNSPPTPGKKTKPQKGRVQLYIFLSISFPDYCMPRLGLLAAMA